jgi:acyl carrier protein
MSNELADTDLIRMARSGVLGLSFADGLSLFDATFGTAEPSLVPVRLDMSGVRADAHSVPAMLRGLVRGGTRRRAEAVDDSWARVVALPAAERDRALLDVVCGTAAVVLGHERRDAIDPRKGFIELGFDSLTAIELRNRLESLTGQRLPATLIFDHPSASALAGFLGAGLADPPSAVEVRLADLETELRALDSSARASVVGRLRELVATFSPADRELEEAGADELFAMLDEELESQG